MSIQAVPVTFPNEVFALIDFKAVKASRIIGTGSRASRIMLMDQMKEMYSTWDAVGRANFEYDYLVELVGAVMVAMGLLAFVC